MSRPASGRRSRTAVNGGRRSFPATIAGTVFLGNRLQVEARLGTGESIVAEVDRSEGVFEPGERVHLWWHDSDELRFPG
ncbi:MAG: TOBE domain-containing protein [Acidobacteria bacterium]|nr:TOBE domain-containing protein [Acidobacteriota bacterium]